MEISSLILFALSVVGMTHIIVDGSIFQPVRDFIQKILPERICQLFTCYQCCGTWCGFLAGAILISLNPWVILLCGCAGSFLAMWSATYLNYLEARTIINLGDDDDEDGE